ncbi:DUF3592 domain-containing protein [Haloferula sp.]|uniref:DUF3592 domain-containing protein n=1 Tax=Haloferula sp. TaxID=2497595 RepID=UPI003C73FBE9
MLKRATSTKQESNGSGCLLVFGILWTLFSSVFVVLGVRESVGEGKVQGWDEVPCQIERFEIKASKKKDPPFRPDVLFRFQYGGKEQVGTKLWREKEGVEEYEDLAEIREEMGSNQQASCRVNPDQPEEAVLLVDQEGIWGGLFFAVFGGVFVMVGIGMIIGAIKDRKSVKLAKSAKSVSGGKKAELGGVLGLGFFGIFAVAGLGILMGLVVPKAKAYLQMKSWVETPAEVIWSRVLSHSSDDGTTYSVDVFYKYQFDGKEYRSNRWNVVGGSSSGRSGKQEVVRAHPRGATFVCFVNPDEPWRAVAKREVGWAGLFVLFPLPFLAVGFGGLYYTLVRKPKKEESARSEGRRLRQEQETRLIETPQRTSSRRRRVWAFVAALFMALFWNGIVSIFVGIAWKSWQRGDGEWFLTIFLIPFVLIGLFLIVHVPYRLMAIFSPVYDLDWGDGALAPGDRVRLSWKRTGGSGRPRKFSIWLVGQEEATYRRGTRTSTATSVFHEANLFETETPLMMPSGACNLVIPEDGVPGFKGEHNKIRWFIRLVADVPWRPDVSDEHELEVGNPAEFKA